MRHVFTGIDPGLVHTGVVSLSFEERRHPEVRYWLVEGPDAEQVSRVLRGISGPKIIEAYRPRSHYDSDARMGKAVNDIRKAVPGSSTLDNTGVKKIVTPELMKLLGVWNFNTPSHHQDLRAAARIGLYGAFKDDTLNRVIYDYVTAVLDGEPWTQERKTNG